MDYSFNSVKHFFDEYDLKKNEYGEFLAMHRSNREFEYGRVIENAVKFAHTWYGSRKRGVSTKTPNGSLEEYYELAFGERAEELYNGIMASVVQRIKAVGPVHFVKKEVLQQEFGHISGAKSTIDGLYSSERCLKSFVDWTNMASNSLTLDQITDWQYNKLR